MHQRHLEALTPEVPVYMESAATAGETNPHRVPPASPSCGCASLVSQMQLFMVNKLKSCGTGNKRRRFHLDMVFGIAKRGKMLP